MISSSPSTRGPIYRRVGEITEVTLLTSGLSLLRGYFYPSRQVDPSPSKIHDTVGLPSMLMSTGPRRVDTPDRIYGGFADVSRLAEIGPRTLSGVDRSMCHAPPRLSSA